MSDPTKPCQDCDWTDCPKRDQPADPLLRALADVSCLLRQIRSTLP